MRSRRNNFFPARFAAIVAVAAMVALLAVFGGAVRVPDALAGAAMSVAAPVWRARASLGAAFAGLATRNRLAQENARLEDELRAARLALFERDTLARENQELKTMLGRGVGDAGIGPYAVPRLLAAVLARPSATPYDTLVIDAGARNGVRTGERVFAAGRVALGVVSEVFADSARVRLFSSPGFEVDAQFSGSGAAVSARGAGGGNFVARLPQEIEVREGDTVLLPGLDGDILGVAAEPERNPADLFQTVRFRTPVNLDTLRWVEVEKAGS